MTSPIYAAVPGSFDTPACTASFIAADGTAAKLLVDVQASQVATGNLPMLSGGCTVIDMTASSTDAANKDMQLYTGNLLTTQDTAGSGAITITAQNTLTRTAGSWIVDGWKPGDTVLGFAAPGVARAAGQDGIVAIVTAVTDLVLTVNGTPFTNGALSAAFRLFKAAPHFRTTIPAGAGTSASVASVGLLNNGSDGSVIRTELKLGPTSILAAAMAAAVSALPATINARAVIARY